MYSQIIRALGYLNSHSMHIPKLLRHSTVQNTYCLFLFLFDWICIKAFEFFRADVRKISKRVLLVRLDAVGDFILWLDAARWLKNFYPGRELILLANTNCADLAKRIPFWDEVWELDRRKFVRNLRYRFRMLKKVWNIGFSIALQPTLSREFSCGDSITRASQAPERIGSVGDCINMIPELKKISDTFFTRLIPASSSLKMELRRNAEFMNGLGRNVEPSLPNLHPIVETIQKSVRPDTKCYYVMSPGASRDFRRWPTSHFAKLAALIYRRIQIPCIIIGLSGEKHLAEEIQRRADVPIVDLTGQTTLTQLTAVIRDALFIVGNETAGIHIAAALSTSAFCLLGGGHYGRFLPYDVGTKSNRPTPIPLIHRMNCYGCNWNCRHPIKTGDPVPCIANISVNQVFAALNRIL